MLLIPLGKYTIFSMKKLLTNKTGNMKEVNEKSDTYTCLLRIYTNVISSFCNIQSHDLCPPPQGTLIKVRWWSRLYIINSTYK